MGLAISSSGESCDGGIGVLNYRDQNPRMINCGKCYRRRCCAQAVYTQILACGTGHIILHHAGFTTAGGRRDDGTQDTVCGALS